MNNVDTLHISYYLDDTTIKDGYELSATYGHTQKDLQRVFREVLTEGEWEKIKGKNGYGLILRIT